MCSFVQTNDYCGVGVAPAASASVWAIFHRAAAYAKTCITDAFRQSVDIMVSDELSNSTDSTHMTLHSFGAAVDAELEAAIAHGRNGHGTVFIFGSAMPLMQDSNHVRIQTIAATITVAPLTRSGLAASGTCPGSLSSRQEPCLHAANVVAVFH
jgi:hypothetical protein